jgi:hypothetical protein
MRSGDAGSGISALSEAEANTASTAGDCVSAGFEASSNPKAMSCSIAAVDESIITPGKGLADFIKSSLPMMVYPRRKVALSKEVYDDFSKNKS